GSLILAPCCCSLIGGADWHDPPPPEHTAPLWPAGLADGGNRGLQRRAVENRRAGPVRSRESGGSSCDGPPAYAESRVAGPGSRRAQRHAIQDGPKQSARPRGQLPGLSAAGLRAGEATV